MKESRTPRPEGGNDGHPEGRQTRRAAVRRFIPLAVLLLGLVLFFALGFDRYLSFQALHDHHEWLRAQVRDNALLAPLAFIAVYALATAFSVPGGAILTIVGGFLFGIWLGTVYVVIGATLGSIGVFLAARTALHDVLQAKAGRAMKRMEEGFREHALSYLLFLRLVPIFPFWLVNLVPALLGVPLGVYVLGTVLGIIPGSFVYASVGNGLGALLERGETPNLGVIFDPEILLPILGLSLLSLLPIVYKRWRKGRSGASN
ncbi:MAG: TVP38/TMEM64 family protein [Rhodovibrionaceae bacterium]|nr:TVP38/TMEM64 family protein [Rhodovibrionaceae bacterium]